MPLPQPRKDEKRSEFMSRCMGSEVMNREFPDQEQRYKICLTQWNKQWNKKKDKK